MELKSRDAVTSKFCIKSSNRTFMELKWAFNRSCIWARVRSNRTFMELK